MKPPAFIKIYWVKYREVLLALFVWRTVLESIRLVTPHFFAQRPGYFGPVEWANFDGVHYLRIASQGYFQFGEAFFPLYPLLLKTVSLIFPVVPVHLSALVLSFLLFAAGIILLCEISSLYSKTGKMDIVLTILTFPTAFFFGAVYTESLFLFLTAAAFFAAIRRNWFLAVLCGALASATRVYGVFIILPVAWAMYGYEKKLTFRHFLYLSVIPLGLIAYMAYLYILRGDPLAFFHVQGAFGANRSGSTLILLPQVIWRYLKIIFLAYMQPTPASYLISVTELLSAVWAAGLIGVSMKLKVPKVLAVYSAFILLIPTLTGTLSSFPRYLLSAFPLFIYTIMIVKPKYKYAYYALSMVLQAVFFTMFVNGYFIG